MSTFNFFNLYDMVDITACVSTQPTGHHAGLCVFATYILGLLGCLYVIEWRVKVDRCEISDIDILRRCNCVGQLGHCDQITPLQSSVSLAGATVRAIDIHLILTK